MDYFINFKTQTYNLIKPHLRRRFQQKSSGDLPEPLELRFSDAPLSLRRDRLHICDETKTELKRDLVYETVGLSRVPGGSESSPAAAAAGVRKKKNVGQFVANCY